MIGVLPGAEHPMGCCGRAVGSTVLGTVAVGSVVRCQAAQLTVHTIEKEKSAQC